jgi:hypothetical protein
MVVELETRHLVDLTVQIKAALTASMLVCRMDIETAEPTES